MKEEKKKRIKDSRSAMGLRKGAAIMEFQVKCMMHSDYRLGID